MNSYLVLFSIVVVLLFQFVCVRHAELHISTPKDSQSGAEETAK